MERWQERCLIWFRSFISGFLVGAAGVTTFTSLRRRVVIPSLSLLDFEIQRYHSCCWVFCFAPMLSNSNDYRWRFYLLGAFAGDAMIRDAARALPEQVVECMGFSCMWKERLSERH